MKKYLVIGNPIDHSLSPKLHNYWIKKNNLNAIYEKRLVKEKDLESLCNDVREGKIEGFNVTVPFKEKIKEYLEIQKNIRSSNISVEIYSGDGNLKTQMKYANKIGSPAVILYGENEIESGKVTLKDLKSGQEISTKIENLNNEIKKII